MVIFFLLFFFKCTTFICNLFTLCVIVTYTQVQILFHLFTTKFSNLTDSKSSLRDLFLGCCMSCCFMTLNNLVTKLINTLFRQRLIFLIKENNLPLFVSSRRPQLIVVFLSPEIPHFKCCKPQLKANCPHYTGCVGPGAYSSCHLSQKINTVDGS